MSKKLLFNNSTGDKFPVEDKLVYWIDGRDGKTGETVIKDRVKGLNFSQPYPITFNKNGFDFSVYYPSSEYNGSLRMETPVKIRFQNSFSVSYTYEVLPNNVGGSSLSSWIVNCGSWFTGFISGFINLNPALSGKHALIQSELIINRGDKYTNTITYDRQEDVVSFYVNGKLINKISTNGKYPQLAEQSVVVGRPYGGNYNDDFSGYFYSLQVFTKKLSDDEVSKIYEYEKNNRK